jgi:hypothetical protein
MTHLRRTFQRPAAIRAAPRIARGVRVLATGVAIVALLAAVALAWMLILSVWAESAGRAIRPVGLVVAVVAQQA